MSGFSIGPLLMVSSFDPLGSWMVKQYPMETRTALATGAAADSRTHSILDAGFLENVYKDPKFTQTWASCIPVHEAVHLRESTKREDIPNEYAYRCLDRMGAPWWMKDYLYKQIQDPMSGYADPQTAAPVSE